MSSLAPAQQRIPTSVHARRAAIAGFFGSALEYYDFLIYGSASALVFAHVFFASVGTAGTLLSIATFGVAYVVRPLGAIVWGHIGDRFGRRRALMWTIGLMGAATFLIGVLPSSASAGLLAPALLVLLRLVQGFAAGGEVPGSTALSVEHAPVGRRAFFTSFSISGEQFGIALGSLVFLPLAAMPSEELLSWAWRIPFLGSGVLTIVAYLFRRLLEEPDAFTQLEADGERSRLPLATLLGGHWATMLRVLLMSTVNIVGTMFNVFALAFGAANQIPTTVMLTVVSLANLIAVIVAPLAGLLSDRVGRKPLFIVSVVGAAACMAPLFIAIHAHNIPMIYLLGILAIGVFFCTAVTIGGTYYPEQYPASVRYSGMAISLMLGILVAGFAPAIAEALGASGSNWIPAAVFCAGAGLVPAIAGAFAPETYRTPTADLGA